MVVSLGGSTFGYGVWSFQCWSAEGLIRRRWLTHAVADMGSLWQDIWIHVLKIFMSMQKQPLGNFLFWKHHVLETWLFLFYFHVVSRRLEILQHFGGNKFLQSGISLSKYLLLLHYIMRYYCFFNYPMCPFGRYKLLTFLERGEKKCLEQSLVQDARKWRDWFASMNVNLFCEVEDVFYSTRLSILKKMKITCSFLIGHYTFWKWIQSCEVEDASD